ncbi:oxidoreductase domain protein [Arthrobacter sp. Hiyo4]|nr:oxidoreductase domain protein [Arthrobacter sp. Hiyo4]
MRSPAACPHPKPVCNPDLPVTESFRSQWQEVPANAELDTGFKLQWEEFLRDVVAGREHRFGLLSAVRGVQLAELGLQSNDERRTIDIPEITL